MVRRQALPENPLAAYFCKAVVPENVIINPETTEGRFNKTFAPVRSNLEALPGGLWRMILISHIRQAAGM